MDEPATAGDERSEPIGRLLSQEANVANLLAYLAELDPAPLLRAMRLRATEPGLVQEVAAGRSGRVDAFVTDHGRPIALLELKVGAAEHGDQFSRYEQLAADRGGLPRHLISLDQDTADVPPGWVHHLLPDLFSGWHHSRSEPARVIAGVLERALRDVMDQAAGPLGHAGRTAVAVAFRQLAGRIRATAPVEGLSGGADRTSGGQPMVVFYVPHPLAQGAGEWLCVDLRSEARGAAWKLRLGVEVDAVHDREGTPAQAIATAQVRANDLAMRLHHALRTSTFVAHLRHEGQVELAESLQISKGDGLRDPYDEVAVNAWRHAAEAGGLKRNGRRLEAHPLFRHDKGRRLSSVTNLDYRTLTVDQLVILVSSALSYLRRAAGVR